MSAIGNKRAFGDAGATLVETLAALAIVALVAGAAMLAAPGPDHEARRTAERLAARLALAGEMSVLRNRPVSLVADGEGYGFARLEEGGWIAWETPSPLAFRAWPAGIEHRASGESDTRDGRLARFDTQGGATPARIELRGGGARYAVTLDGEGKAHVARAE